MGRTILTILSLSLLLLSFGSCNLWDNVFPSPTDGTINSGVFGPEGFLLVGDQGLMLYSLNGTNWETCYSPLDGDYSYSSYTNGYYIRSNQGEGVTAFSPDNACHNIPEWEVLGNVMGEFSLDFQFAPAPVPTGYTGPFVGISNHKAYISQTGSPMDMGEIAGIDYTLYEAWAVYYANNTFMIKLAGKPESAIEFEIYFISSPDGQSWTNPLRSGYSAFYDYSLSFCSVSQKWIMAANEGICVSTDGVVWYLTLASPNYKFAKMDCYGDRCVASNYTNLFDSSNCKYFQENTPIGLVMSDGFPIVSPTGTFVVAGRMGAIQYSDTYLAWHSSGAPYSQTGEFVGCSQLIAGNDFFLSCMQSIFVSADGINWTYKPYLLSSTSTLQITNLLYADDQLIAVAGLNKIYTSTNSGTNWQFVLQFDPDATSPPSVETLKYSGGKIIGIGELPWGSGSSATAVPFLAIGDSADSWAYFATSAWLYDVTYLSDNEYWLGAGEGGIYYSENFYDWTVLSSVNGHCTTVVYESSIAVALCYNQGDGGVVDQVIKLSGDGHTWTNYLSPCNQTYRDPIEPQLCAHMSFVPAWDRFVLYSENATGTIYASLNGTAWSLVEFPFAMGLYAIVQLNETIATLTDDSVLSGSTGSTDFLLPRQLSPYTESTSSSYNPNFPKVGPIGTQSAGLSSYADTSSSGGIGGGSVFGIIVAICVVLFVASIIVGGVVYYLKVKKSRGNKEVRPILAGTDENDML